MNGLAEIAPADIANREQILRDLAQDIAKNIEDIPDILKRFGLTYEEYQQVANTTPFKAMLQTAVTEWGGADNTPERIKLKAALAVEQAIPAMFGAINDTKETLSGRVEAMKTLAKIGGLGNPPPPNQGPTGQTFKLEIKFPDPAKNITIEHALPELPAKVTDEDDFLDVNDELL